LFYCYYLKIIFNFIIDFYITFIQVFIKILVLYNIIMNENILSKEEVLKITNKYYISYYCKDDICVLSDYDYYN